MELVKGVPITRFCDERRLTPMQRLELFVQVCQAVQHAHQKGIIHRDLKPSNVMVCLYDGKPVPKVIDFGVAKAAGQKLTERTMFTEIGQVVGTLEYMSPEQAELNQLDVDTRSDIYSLGVLLYELLTGSTPLERKRLKTAAMLEVLRLIREEEPPRPSTRLSATDELPSVAANRGLEPRKLSSLVRGELDWIVMKALDKDRNRRYETANGFAQDIERYMQNEPVQACPPSNLYRLRKLARRNRALFTTATAIAIALIVAVVGVTWNWWEAEWLRKQEAWAKGQAETAAQRALQAERNARLREAEALVGQARGTRLSHRPGQRFAALANLTKAAAIGRELGQPLGWFDALRNEAIAALALPDIHITKEWDGFPPGSVCVVLSDDFEVYARTTDKGGCTFRRVADDTEIAPLPELGEPARAEFGPTRALALCGNTSGRFRLWELSGTKPLPQFEERGVDTWAFQPRGLLIALLHNDGAISVYELAKMTRVYRHECAIPRGHKLSFHPTELLLGISTYGSGVLSVYNLRTGAVVASATTPWQGGNGTCAWSPDGRTLLVPAGDSSKIQEYAFDTAAPALLPTRQLDMPRQGAPILTFNSAGDRFVGTGWSNNVNLVDVVSGQLLFTTPPLPSAGGHELRFDSTGNRLAGARVGDRFDRFGLWSVADGREYRSLVPKSGLTPKGAVIDRAGRLAALGLSSGVALFDLKSGRELATHLPIPGGAGSIAFDGKGNLLSNGWGGCFRWPVRTDPANSERLTFGPPEPLPFHRGDLQISASNDGLVVAQCMWNGYGMQAYAGGWILHPNSPKPQRVADGIGMGHCSVSPDGSWIAFGARDPYQVQVYNAASGQRVWESRVAASPPNLGRCFFSSDGRWLITTVDGGRLYAVGNWKPGPQLGPGIPYDATADLAVLAQTSGIYRLVELATGRELARLEDAELNSGQAFFTSDGTKLVIHANNGLRIWDLRLIRRQLAAMGLDWDAPPYPLAAADNAPPLSVTVDLCDKLWREIADARARGETREYRIESAVKAGLVLGVRDANAVENAPLHLEGPGDAANRRWRLIPVDNGEYVIESVLKNGMVFDVRRARAEKGTVVELYGGQDNHLRENRRWRLIPTGEDGIYQIESVLKRGLVLEVKDGSAENGASIQIGEAEYDARQRWRLVRVDPGK